MQHVRQFTRRRQYAIYKLHERIRELHEEPVINTDEYDKFYTESILSFIHTNKTQHKKLFIFNADDFYRENFNVEIQHVENKINKLKRISFMDRMTSRFLYIVNGYDYKFQGCKIIRVKDPCYMVLFNQDTLLIDVKFMWCIHPHYKAVLAKMKIIEHLQRLSATTLQEMNLQHEVIIRAKHSEDATLFEVFVIIKTKN